MVERRDERQDLGAEGWVSGRGDARDEEVRVRRREGFAAHGRLYACGLFFRRFLWGSEGWKVLIRQGKSGGQM